MRPRARQLAALGLAAALLASGLGLVTVLGGGMDLADAVPTARPARISPDYAGTVIPPNIAPLNFTVQEPGRRYRVVAAGGREGRAEASSYKGSAAFPVRAWRRLLDANRGGTIAFDVYVQDGAGVHAFEPFTVEVAAEEIDPYLAYRYMNPIYRVMTNMDIRQRDLTGFAERTVVNTGFYGGCMNCHTLKDNRTDDMLIHTRSAEFGHGMLMARDGVISKVDTRTELSIGFAAYSSWHPNGRLIAFSMNGVRQFFHSARAEVRDVLDIASDVAVYVIDRNEVTSNIGLASKQRLETWPMWSPDGLYLYFCSAPVLWTAGEGGPTMERFEELKYDLMRIRYDAEANTWGEPETVLTAADTGMSINELRFSPDGRFLAFCMSDYSNFPAFRSSSDLYLMDMTTGQHRRMQCNSPWAESWHCWSSNGRWMAFTSKRPDGQFQKVYFTYVDETGADRKPFILPQRDPAFYDSFVQLFQMPELITEPVPLGRRELMRVVLQEPWQHVGLPITAATPSAGTGAREPAAPGGIWSTARK